MSYGLLGAGAALQQYNAQSNQNDAASREMQMEAARQVLQQTLQTQRIDADNDQSDKQLAAAQAAANAKAQRDDMTARAGIVGGWGSQLQTLGKNPQILSNIRDGYEKLHPGISRSLPIPGDSNGATMGVQQENADGTVTTMDDPTPNVIPPVVTDADLARQQGAQKDANASYQSLLDSRPDALGKFGALPTTEMQARAGIQFNDELARRGRAAGVPDSEVLAQDAPVPGTPITAPNPGTDNGYGPMALNISAARQAMQTAGIMPAPADTITTGYQPRYPMTPQDQASAASVAHMGNEDNVANQNLALNDKRLTLDESDKAQQRDLTRRGQDISAQTAANNLAGANYRQLIGIGAQTDQTKMRIDAEATRQAASRGATAAQRTAAQSQEYQKQRDAAGEQGNNIGAILQAGVDNTGAKLNAGQIQRYQQLQQQSIKTYQYWDGQVRATGAASPFRAAPDSSPRTSPATTPAAPGNTVKDSRGTTYTWK